MFRFIDRILEKVEIFFVKIVFVIMKFIMVVKVVLIMIIIVLVIVVIIIVIIIVVKRKLDVLIIFYSKRVRKDGSFFGLYLLICCFI